LTVAILLGVAATLSAQQPNWEPFEKALASAETTNKLILVDVWAPWCGWCHKMKKETYPRLPKVLRKVFVFSRLNRDDHDTEHNYRGQRRSEMQLAKQLNAQTVPTVIILSANGKYLFHLSGYLSAKKLGKVLRQTQQATFRQ
jgi:thioredoxin-related protein